MQGVCLVRGLMGRTITLQLLLFTSCAAGTYSCPVLVAILSGTLASTAMIGRRERPLRATMARLSLALTTSYSMPLRCTRRMVRTSATSVAPSAA